VTAEPPDQMPAAAGRGDLRASHADREQAIGTLKGAFVQGRLAKDEFDLRVGQALASRTYAELVAVTADLPAGLTTAQPPKPAQAPSGPPILRRPGLVGTVATVLYAGMWPLAFVLPRSGDGYPVDGINLIGVATPVYMLVLISAYVWTQALRSRRETPSGGQLPRRPAPGADGQAPRRLPSADPGGQVPPVDPGHRHTAEAARRRLPRPSSPVRGHCVGGALAAGTAPARG
jgi:DUF1707 SHOCT-like domain